MGYIYKVSNIVNNKVYIGKTIETINTRWTRHKWEAFDVSSPLYNIHFYRAIRKYGIENFKIEIIEEATNDKLTEREKYWIKQFNSYNDGYNSTLGGEGAIRYEDEDFLELWDKGYGTQYIADLLGCSVGTAGKRLKLLIPNYEEENKKRHGRGTPQFLEREKKVHELWDEGKSGIEIKEALNIGKDALKMHLFNYENFDKEEYKRRTIKENTKRYNKNNIIRQLDLEGNLIATFPSISEAIRQLGPGHNVSNISSCINGKSKTAYGYKWERIKTMEE